jgi:hypothetical protein
MGGMMLMRAIDVNHNGELSAEEIKGAGAAILKALDKNGDKKISKEELMPRRREGEGGRRPPRRGAGEGQQGRKRPPRRGGGEGEEGVRRLRRGGEGREAGERKRPEAEE